MNKKQKKVLTRIIIAAVLMIAFSFLTVEDYTAFVLFLIPYLVIGYDILIKAGKGIKNHQVFDENFLMAVATVGAIALGDYREGVAVMLFYQIGELFQSYAVGKSRRNISDLMDIRPDYANIERDGEIEEVDPDEVEIGSIIVVKPGEKVPIDGVIIEGTTTLNTSALTGESVPRDASEGDEVISGCINMTGVLRIKTTKEFGESTALLAGDALLTLAFETAAGAPLLTDLKKVPFRELYFQVCQILHTGCMLWCVGAGSASADCQDAFYGFFTGMGRLDHASVDIPCHQLPMCPCYQYSA